MYAGIGPVLLIIKSHRDVARQHNVVEVACIALVGCATTSCFWGVAASVSSRVDQKKEVDAGKVVTSLIESDDVIKLYQKVVSMNGSGR